MKINCESCNTRYAVPDDKVRGAGRTFKITCRKCGAPILVQGIAADGDGGAETAWYYAVGTERKGPVERDELQRLVDEGVLAGDSYVWCQGMASWEHLQSVDALASMVEHAPAPVPEARAEAPAETPAERATEAEIAAASTAMKTIHELSALTPEAAPPESEAPAAEAPEAEAPPEEEGSDTTMIPQEQIAAAHAQYASESLFATSSKNDAASLFGADDEDEAAESATPAADAPLFGSFDAAGSDDGSSDLDMPLFGSSSDGAGASKGSGEAPAKASSSLFDSPEVVAGAADDDDIFGSDDVDDSASGGGSAGVHGRRETSVLFSLDDIGSSGEATGTHEDSLVTESSGLIDIRAVAARSNVREDTSGNPFGDDAASSLVLPGGSSGVTLAAPIVQRRRSSGLKMAMVAVLALGVGGVVMWWMMSQQTPTPAPEARTVAPATEQAAPAAAAADKGAAVAEAGTAAAAAAGAEGGAPAGAEAAAAAGAEPEAGAEPAAAAAEGAEAGAEAPAEADKAAAPEAKEEPAKAAAPEPTRPKPEPTRPKAEPKAHAEPKPEPKPEPRREPEVPKAAPTAGGSSKDVNDLLKQLNEKKKAEEPAPASDDSGSAGSGLPPKLGAAALKGTLRKRHGSFSACYASQPDRPPGSVTVKTTIVIASSGAVTSARVTGGGGTTSDVQSCIVNALLATKFSGFTDPQMIVNYPIVLR